MHKIVGLGEFSNSQFKTATAKFKCAGHQKLLDYLLKNAHNHHKQGFFQTYLFQDEEAYKAYISLASTHITEDSKKLRDELEVSESMPYDIPALKITRLCVSDEFKREKIGTLLIEFAKIVAYEQQIKIGCRALLVDAKSEAVEFYKSLGFEILSEMEDGIISMFLDIPSLRSKDVKDESAKEELVRSFILFCETFDLSQFSDVFKKML